MKKLLLIASISSILFACSGVKTYTINGTMPDSLSNGTMVYLIDYGSNLTVDSCVVADAKFIFKGTATDSLPILRIDALANSRYYANVVMEPGVINVNMDRRSQVGGAPLNDAYAMYSSSIDSIDNLYSRKLKSATQESEIDSLEAVYEYELDEVVNKYITGNEQNPLGLYIAWEILGGSTGKAQTVELIDSYINNGGEIFKKFQPIQNMRENLVNREKTSVGNIFVDFDAKNSDDSPVKLSDYVGKGKYVLVDFWASWCGPCKAEVPAIKEVYNNYKDKGLVVLGINVWDSKEAFEKSVVELEMPWAQIYASETMTPTKLYGISGIPHIILFAPDGTIADRGLRGDRMKAKIADIFAE